MLMLLSTAQAAQVTMDELKVWRDELMPESEKQAEVSFYAPPEVVLASRKEMEAELATFASALLKQGTLLLAPFEIPKAL